MKQKLLNIWYGLQFIAQCIVYLIGYIFAASIFFFPIGLVVVAICLYIIALFFAAGIEIYGYKIPFIVIVLMSIPFSLLIYYGLKKLYSNMKEYIEKKNKERIEYEMPTTTHNEKSLHSRCKDINK